MKIKFRLNEIAFNVLNLSSINVLNLIVALITLPYLSRVLGPENCGYYFIFISATIFAAIFTDYSTQITGVRQVAQNQNPAKLQPLYNEFQAVRMVFGIAACLIFTAYTLYTVPSVSIGIIAGYFVLTLVGHYLTAAWFHQGISRLSTLAISTLVSRLLQIAALLWLVNGPNDMLTAVFINAFAYAVTGVCALWYRTYHLSIHEKLDFSQVLRTVRQGWNSFVGDFAPNLYSNIPLLVIGSLVSPAVFAGYSMAMRLVAIAGAVQLMMSKGAYPVIAKGKGKFVHLLQLNILMSLIPVLVIWLCGDRVITFFLGDAYPDVVNYLKYLSPGILFNGMLSAFAYGYFLPNRHDTVFRNTSVFVSLVSAVIGYGLIYVWSVKGAIAMFVFARALFVLCYVLAYRRLTRL
jgi:O-antigen/teichoic acid export membrane protein